MAEVTFSEVGKVYDNGFQAVQDLSLAIEDGEFLVLVGPSGCGKTTLLRCIDGLLPLSEGEIVVEGTRVTEPLPGRTGPLGTPGGADKLGEVGIDTPFVAAYQTLAGTQP